MAMREYQPFAYPPDFDLARIHQEASKPGKIDPTTSVKCPCCSQSTKTQLKFWMNRSIDQDFKNYGGSVVTYFWLVKLYAFICLLILLVYSSYLIVSIHNVCNEGSEEEGALKCQTFLGIYVITNQSLFELMQKLHKKQSMTRILTLRTITYAILMIGNLMALYTSGRFKRRYPQPKKINNFSLIFKNVQGTVQQFTLQLKSQFPQAELVEVFNLKTLQPFYTNYNKKLETYFLTIIEDNPKAKDKLLKKLRALDRECQKEEGNYEVQSDRVIVVFQSEAQRDRVKLRYELKGIVKAKYLLGFENNKKDMYCQDCPTCEEIIWNNIGSDDTQKIKSKVLSVVYFLLLIGGSYLLLFFCMHLVYDRDTLPKPLNQIIANLVMIMMLPISITFRKFMNMLSEMRHPNTQTSRTLFIILTTVLFHFIYYVLVPTFYLNFSHKVDKNKVMYIVTNQTFTFLIVQFILAYLDFIFCQWNRRLKKVQNEEKPIGCQKILHEQMQYPRFPIEFKHIILFKTFSFIILCAFQSPFLMFLCFVLLVFLYFTDKFSVYRHYRMEIIDNKVQYKILKVYSVFFSAYTFLIYSLTQHFEDLNIEFYAALVLMIVAMLIQIFYIKDKVFEDEAILPSTLKDEKIDDSYKERFNKFREHVIDDKLNMEIKQFLLKLGEGSLQTEDSLSKLKLIDS